MMYPILRQDVFKLLADAEKIKFGLNTLKQDRALWARDCEKDDLTDLLNNLKRLEYDVVKTASDWNLLVCRMPKNKNNSQLSNSFHYVFVKLSKLFNDLKYMRKEMTENYIHSDSLRQLEIDWKRFYKTTGQIRQYIMNGIIFLKAGDVPGRDTEY